MKNNFIIEDDVPIIAKVCYCTKYECVDRALQLTMQLHFVETTTGEYQYGIAKMILYFKTF